MWIERHHVGQAAVAAARDDFANRIGGLARSMSKAGPIATCEWQLLAGEFLDYLGALSVEQPDLDTPEAKAVLKDAAEAAAGAVAYAAYHPHDSFQVMLDDYVNFGMSYDPGGLRTRGTRSPRAEPGTEAEVTIDGQTLSYPAARDDSAGPGHWQTATALAPRGDGPTLGAILKPAGRGR
ncbi:hypothetical protein ACFCY8_10550 [Streptomyces noursei]|uniref:hypothetical protein n=1 Tax=Streptomyces noursei TaxID=1971 RepID=UPI0035E09FFB